MHTAAETRSLILAKRHMLSAKEIEDASMKMAQQLITLPEYMNAGSIGCYIAINGEIDPRFIVEHCKQQDKNVYLPIIQSNKSLMFGKYNANTKMKENLYKIPEPDSETSNTIGIEGLDLVLVPTVAFNMQCQRIGMGQGYYDRTLKNTNCRKIGLAYQFQLHQEMDTKPWDIAMDVIVTEQQIYSK